MEQNERVIKDMSIGEVLDYSIELYRQNFKQLTMLALIFYVPFMAVYTLIISSLSGSMVNIAGLYGNAGNIADIPYTLITYYMVLMSMGIVYFAYTIILKPVMDASVIRIIYSDAAGQKGFDLKPLIRDNFKKLPSYIVNRLLYGLILFGVGLGAYIVLVIFILVFAFSASKSFVSPGGSAGSTIVTIIGAIAVIAFIFFLILLLAYLGVKFAFGTHAIALENKTAVEALGRSSRLAKKRFWHIALAYMFGAILLFAVPWMLSAGSSFLIAVNKQAYIAATIGTQILFAILDPFFMVLLTTIFIGLKAEKEGLDLEVKVDRLLEKSKGIESEDANAPQT